MFQYGDQQDQNSQPGDRFVERFSAMDYNLRVQRGDTQGAADVFARFMGFLMSKAAGR